MLKAFVGTYNAAGLQNLRCDDAGEDGSPSCEARSLPFWAVLDSAEVAAIQQAIVYGERQAALRQLVTVAKSFGPVAS